QRPGHERQGRWQTGHHDPAEGLPSDGRGRQSAAGTSGFLRGCISLYREGFPGGYSAGDRTQQERFQACNRAALSGAAGRNQRRKNKKERMTDMRKTISTDKAPAAVGTYAQAIEANGMGYTSGSSPARA